MDPFETATSRATVDIMDEDESDHAMAEDADLPLESQEYFDAESQLQDKGKGKVTDVDEEDEKPFPLMELPTEIRLEIYRACLTRPHKILLSKLEKPPPEKPANELYPPAPSESDNSTDEDHQAAIHRYHQARAVRLRAFGRSHARRVPSATTTTTSVSHNRYTFLAPSAYSAPASGSSTPTASLNTNAGGASSNSHGVQASAANATTSRRVTKRIEYSYALRPKSEDLLIIAILGTSKDVYKEARGVLYSENIFKVDLTTALSSLAVLHQRSRRHIKHVELEIPTYTDILERFSEVVRLSLRYCSGLKKLVIHTPFHLPGADGNQNACNTAVYANGFDILRWLPQQCEVILKGSRNAEIETVVKKHLTLAKNQDKVRTYAVRMHDGIEHGVIYYTMRRDRDLPATGLSG